MRIQDSFLFRTYRNIKQKLPDYVLRSMNRLLPVYFVSSLFEIFGLALLFPVIKVIIDPSNIENNYYLHTIYIHFNFSSHLSFVLFLLSTITFLFILKNIILFLIYRRLSRVAFYLSEKIAFGKYLSYLNKPFQFHAEHNTANLLRNFVQIPFDLMSYAVLPCFNIINELFIVSLLVIGIAIFDPLLFVSLLLFTIPFLFIYNRVYRRTLKEISAKMNISHAGMYKTGLQSMEGFREITVFNKKKYFSTEFEKHLHTFTNTAGKNYLMNIFSPKIVETAAVLCIFFIFLFGYIFQKDLAALAQFMILFCIAAYRIIPSINKMILSLNYIKSSAYVFEFFEKADFEGENRTGEDRTAITLQFTKEFSIKDLSFRFRNKEGFVLQKINISIPKKKTIGIIGPSGSGKTTLLNILLRLHEEHEGGIFIDGVKIDSSKAAEWYRLVSYVPQNTTLLDGTIRENIAFGINEKNVDNKLLNDVIATSLLKEFVNSLPNGVDEQIGEKGIKISGGQRQRIGIARALYHQGQILIFDEATSSLDYETEKMLTESIDNISHHTDLTIIIVAHRLQTLEFCDEIYKLENGKIVEATTYSELIRNKKVE